MEEIINKPEIFVIYMLRDLSKQQVEIFRSIDHVYFCRFNQTVQDCTCLCTVGRFDPCKVFATNCKRSDCLFCIVVVHRDIPVR